ncbi:MAG: hypothetical protein K2Q22_11300, partial [Cytophagales bacterium]|nr:hypothetical protein [Cytophagales bacterium]
EIFKTLGASASNQALNEAFLLEIDNIISASVITELSNALNLRIYGDVPKLFKVNSKELIDFMSSKIEKHDPSSMIFGNTTFQFDKQDSVHPQFIWKISRKIFDMVPAQYITI